MMGKFSVSESAVLAKFGIGGTLEAGVIGRHKWPGLEAGISGQDWRHVTLDFTKVQFWKLFNLWSVKCYNFQTIQILFTPS